MLVSTFGLSYQSGLEFVLEVKIIRFLYIFSILFLLPLSKMKESPHLDNIQLFYFVEEEKMTKHASVL